MASDTTTTHFKPSLGLLDATMIVAGNMIGSGIFIVSADITRNVGSAGWLLLVWLITGFMTLTAALSYGELGALFPKAGGQYVYLKEAYNPLLGFLYGWSFFSVIQTATIAAVGVAFAKFTAYLLPVFSEDNTLWALHRNGETIFHVSPAQLLSIGVIVVLTYINTRGIRSGKLIQTTITLAKLLSLFGLIVFGLLAAKGTVWSANWTHAWGLHGLAAGTSSGAGTVAGGTVGGFIQYLPIAAFGAIAAAMVGSIFSSDSWHNVTFIAGEIRNPKRNIGLSLALGTGIVTLIYLSANVMYTAVLPLHDIAFAEKDRVAVAAAHVIFGHAGTILIALLIMVSTFGCNNGLILAGARVYYTMAQDGLFFRRTGVLNKNSVPGFALWLQCLFAAAWCLSGKYGDLLDMISFVVVGFYMLTIAGIFILRKKRPDAERSYKAIGYPVLPILYILMGLAFCGLLIVYKPRFTWPGLIITLIGIPVYYWVDRSRRGTILPSGEKTPGAGNADGAGNVDGAGKAAGTAVTLTLLAILVPAMGKGQQKDYPIQPVPFTHVRVDDKFWAPKIEVNREVTIPYVLKMCEVHGRIANFKAAADHTGAKLSVYPFDDTDLYKAIEGASYGLQVRKNPALERYLDTLIGYIAAAQEPDGYLYTFRSAEEAHPHPWIGAKRWQNEEILSHELYDAGHLYEAAVAHYQATGKRTLLNIALKNADLLTRTFGYGKIEEYPGHQIVEIGLVKLYRVTGQRKYLDLAKFFLDVRGPGGETYNQANKKVVDQDSAEGHAVRAGYMYTGIADVAALTGNTPYEQAIDAIWKDVSDSKLYITGGIGATNDGEAFGGPFELPNMSAYCETCASIANVYWNSRMFLLHGDSKYIDVLERTLYNSLLSGVSLDGMRFFYPNPLASMGQNERSAWFDCACCITNMARFLPSMPGYVYAQDGNNLYVNLFVGSDASIRLTGGDIHITQHTDYPWSGRVDLEVEPGAPTGTMATSSRATTAASTRAATAPSLRAALRIRIPGWAAGRPSPGGLYFDAIEKTVQPVAILVNGRPVQYAIVKGYAVLDRTWAKGDRVSVDFPMETQKVLADPRVTDDKGRFAFQRGPIVYCLEGPDNKDSLVRNIVVDTAAAARVTYNEGLLGGVDELKMQGMSLKRQPGDTALLQTPSAVTAIPYFAWANRGPSEMTVWVPYKMSASIPEAFPTIASKSKVSSSLGKVRMLRALNDQYDPKDSKDNSMPYLHWWPKKDTTEWVQYDFDQVYTVSSSKVYWYDDGPWGGCRIPAAWTLYYLKDGAWLPVHNTSSYEIARDRYNHVQFDPVTTKALRLVVRLPADNSTGIHEWSVE
jgi:DUF1680 family protein/amino acid transporter